MKNYFAFIDESGNPTQERFFGLGLLMISVMYDYKKNTGLISPKLAIKQDPVVDRLHSILGIESLVGSKTYHKLNYFSVWEFKK